MHPPAGCYTQQLSREKSGLSDSFVNSKGNRKRKKIKGITWFGHTFGKCFGFSFAESLQQATSKRAVITMLYKVGGTRLKFIGIITVIPNGCVCPPLFMDETDLFVTVVFVSDLFRYCNLIYEVKLNVCHEVQSRPFSWC